MKKILLVKTTSLGDLIHTMPAVTDLQQAFGDYELHWLVEESFKDIPKWHPFVKKVHTCAIRRWRKSLVAASTRDEIRQLKASLQAEKFDCVIDAQGLVKSAWMVRWLKIERHGYDKNSIREPLASRVYTVKHNISRKGTAIERNRQLLSESNGYALPQGQADFGLAIDKPDDFELHSASRYCVFLHGTNWESKIWPVEYWKDLARQMETHGIQVYIPWGDEAEKVRANTIAEGIGAKVLDRMPLTHLAYMLQNADFVVGSDTGLSHISAALGTVTIGLYGSTNSALTGLVGKNVVSLQSDKDCSPCMKRECPLIQGDEKIPCYASIDPDRVVAELKNAKVIE